MLSTVLMILTIVFLLLAAFGVSVRGVHFGWLGMALLAFLLLT
jgi:hypothetical protein